MNRTQPTSQALYMAQNTNTGQVHDWLCHSDGSTCQDGCDAPALPETLSQYEKAKTCLWSRQSKST